MVKKPVVSTLDAPQVDNQKNVLCSLSMSWPENLSNGVVTCAEYFARTRPSSNLQPVQTLNTSSASGDGWIAKISVLSLGARSSPTALTFMAEEVNGRRAIQLKNHRRRTHLRRAISAGMISAG